jgi:hypothetical protein
MGGGEEKGFKFKFNFYFSPKEIGSKIKAMTIQSIH